MNHRPNILFFFPDQHRFDWMGHNPDIPVRTPNLDALAARGLRFNKVVCPSPLCAPSRACLATGREYDHCSVQDHSVNLPLNETTYYKLLRDAGGYHVAGVGKFDLAKSTETWGVDGQDSLDEWGFSEGINNAGKSDAVRSGAETPKDPYMAYLHQRGLARAHVQDMRARGGFAGTDPTPLPDDAYCDNWIAENGLNLLERFPTDKPWHLVVNFTGPHSPMDVTKEMHTWYSGEAFPQPRLTDAERAVAKRSFTEDTHLAIRRNYSSMVENIDRWLGVYLESIGRRGELDNTLVVYASDHGELLGDHGLWAKQSPYHPSVSVPLVIAGPGVAAGPPSDALVSLIDLHATFLEYAGVNLPGGSQSRSLIPVLRGAETTHRPHVLSGLEGWRMVWDGRYKLVVDRSGETGRALPGLAALPPPLLFDLEADPWEQHNLAALRPEIVARLERLTRNGGG